MSDDERRQKLASYPWYIRMRLLLVLGTLLAFWLILHDKLVWAFATIPVTLMVDFIIFAIQVDHHDSRSKVP